MNKKILLRIAAGLVLFTCVGHTIGTFMPLPPEEVELVKVENAMKSALVPFPIGKSQSFFDILLGANLSLSVFLLITGLSFLFMEDNTNTTNRKLLLLNSLGLVAIGIISAIYFFPVPAMCTGVAGILGCVVYFT
ncbi:MAG: hypothetical protein KBF93_18590 [Leptospiraceae bacterium]|nr:hypothetical protein [Leptospiraceae bacterium]